MKSAKRMTTLIKRLYVLVGAFAILLSCTSLLHQSTRRSYVTVSAFSSSLSSSSRRGIVNGRSKLLRHAFAGDDATGGGGFRGANHGDVPKWKLSNDFMSFLNQCSIQSFIFLVNSLRDRHTALWVEEFTSPILRERDQVDKKKDGGSDKTLSDMAKALRENMPNDLEDEIKLLTYHGLGAINTTMFPTWNSYFEQMLEEDAFTYLIESSRPNVPSYELDINPVSLCGRILSIREQIAREFSRDLDVIADMSGTMLDTYYDNLKKKYRSSSASDNNDDYGQVDVKQSAKLLFLQFGVDHDMADSSDLKPSPLRSGNFDLLILLCTQEAIHRVLNGDGELATTSNDKSSNMQFLRNFYSNRIGTHFTGSNWYGRADDFMEELLATPPSVVQLQDEECGLIDPEGIVRSILTRREEVASEWLDLALDTPDLHSGMKRRQLNKLMGIDDTSMSENNSFQ